MGVGYDLPVGQPHHPWGGGGDAVVVGDEEDGGAALDNVILPLIYRGTSIFEREELARAALERVGMDASTPEMISTCLASEMPVDTTTGQ